jgi:sucrose phosphorylase
MNERIAEHVRTVYGESVAQVLIPQISELVNRTRAQLPSSSRRELSGLSQEDVLLISYADQVRDGEEPPLKTLAHFGRRRLKGLISGIHLLPFYPWSSDDGFSVKDYYAVDAAFGSWADIERLASEWDLMFDAVLNHMSAQSEWFHKYKEGAPEYRDFFLTISGEPSLAEVIRPRALPLLTEFECAHGVRKIWTTFSADQVDLNYRDPRVLVAMLEVILFYVRKGARFLRLDAVAFLWKEAGTGCLHLAQTHRLVQLFRAVLDEAAPFVRLITETNVAHVDNLSYFGNGRNEAQLVYNFALPPLVLHSFLAANAKSLTRWAQSLVLPSESVTFLNFLASHDGIGLNPVSGILSEIEIEAMVRRTREAGGQVSYKAVKGGATVAYELNINYLDALAPVDGGESEEVVSRKFLTAQAIMLSLQGVPAIYFHSLVGSRGDPAGARATGIPRRINRKKLTLSELETSLEDPGTLGARAFTGYAALLKQRLVSRSLSPDSIQHVHDLDPRVFAVLRESRDGAERLLCVHNVSAEGISLKYANKTIHLDPFGCDWVPV